MLALKVFSIAFAGIGMLMAGTLRAEATLAAANGFPVLLTPTSRLSGETSAALTDLGITDVLLLERDQLTSGTTWHAAGLLPLFNMSYTVGQLHKYSVDLYKRLPAETGQEVGFHVTGNLRLATCRDRMDEYHKYCGTANTIGVPFEIITPRQVAKLWPLCNVKGVVGALFHPQDGHVAPVDVTQALAKG